MLGDGLGGNRKIQTHLRDGSTILSSTLFILGLHHSYHCWVHAQSLRNVFPVCWTKKQILKWEMWLLWYLFIRGYILLILALNSAARNAAVGRGWVNFQNISEVWLSESLKMGIKGNLLNKPSAHNGIITTLLLHTVDYTKAWRLISATATIY